MAEELDAKGLDFADFRRELVALAAVRDEANAADDPLAKSVDAARTVALGLDYWHVPADSAIDSTRT